ncbi:MarC family protein [Amphritea sp. ZJ14W]|nr:MarC family protein [Amphritea pacifica]
MDNTTVHFLTVFMAFFAIMNPVANSSLFIGLTDDFDNRTRRLIALRSVIVAFLIVAVFAIGGRQIFAMFGITLPAFRIAGGIMIALIGYHMLQGEHSSIHTPSSSDNEKSVDSSVDISITPPGHPDSCRSRNHCHRDEFCRAIHDRRDLPGIDCLCCDVLPDLHRLYRWAVAGAIFRPECDQGYLPSDGTHSGGDRGTDAD